MRHECECDHNARNIHFQDTVKIFGNPDAEVGSDERNKYEKYKDIERNVQNAIELVAQNMDPSKESMQALLDELIIQLEEYYRKAPDLSKYIQVDVNGHVITYPMIFIISQQTYDNLSNEDKLDSRKIYLIADVDSSSDPMLNSEIIFQRSIFIKGSARGINYPEGDIGEIIIDLHPIRRSGPIFSEDDFEILDRLYEQRSISDSAQTAAEEAIENFGYTSMDDLNLIRDWIPYLDSLTRFDIDLFAKYLETTGGNTTYTNDDDAKAVWADFLKTYDPMGYWQTWDFNKDGSIDSKDALLVSQYAAEVGTGTVTKLPDWQKQISRVNTIDSNVFDGNINARFSSEILKFAACVGTGTLGKGSTFDMLKTYVSRQYGQK